MKILLLGEYSNLHNTLAEGLRELGHTVTVASDGDGFKNYPRDIDLQRKSSSIKDTFGAIWKVLKNLKNFRGYDVVQLINPCFTTLSVNINQKLYNYLKQNNKKIFLGAFGDDSVWLKACLDQKTFRYSEFYIYGKENKLSYNEKLKSAWLGTSREILNNQIAETCDGIIACLCEYYMAYEKKYKNKLTYIPLPINLTEEKVTKVKPTNKIKFFIGINRDRSEFKGTDKLTDNLLKLYNNYREEIEINIVESIPYKDYIQIISETDVVLDQLYSYSPAMNGLLALAKGKVLVGGGEPEMYNLLPEELNRPIINVTPLDDDVYRNLENIVLNKGNISEISADGRRFVEKHHNHIKVAQQYLDFWMK